MRPLEPIWYPKFQTLPVASVPALASAIERRPESIETLDLRSYLKHADWLVRSSAARELGRRKDIQACGDLIHVLSDFYQSDAVLHPAEFAAWALGEIGCTGAALPLSRAAGSAPSNVRGAAIVALAHVSGGVEQLHGLLGSEIKGVRQDVVASLGCAGSRQSIPKLRNVLRDKCEYVRANAIWALAALKAREAVPDVAALIQDPRTMVREYAVWALGELC